MRIIGGEHRGLALASVGKGDVSAHLRPTSDRVRESLFNLLAHTHGDPVPGARVLDLFAGTGVLGLEAVSRGAAHAQLVEADAGLAQALAEAAARLDPEGRVAVHRGDALGWLRGCAGERFDIAFLDPPFAADLWQAALAALPAVMAADAWLYVESPQDHTPALPAEWALHRENRTRDVRYALYRRGTLAQVHRSGDPQTT